MIQISSSNNKVQPATASSTPRLNHARCAMPLHAGPESTTSSSLPPYMMQPTKVSVSLMSPSTLKSRSTMLTARKWVHSATSAPWTTRSTRSTTTNAVAPTSTKQAEIRSQESRQIVGFPVCCSNFSRGTLLPQVSPIIQSPAQSTRTELTSAV